MITSHRQQYPDYVLDQLIDESTFGWLLRDKAVIAANYSLSDLAELDGRLAANLDALQQEDSTAWSGCLRAMKSGEIGAYFLATTLAIDTTTDRRFEDIIESANSTDFEIREIVSAMGWANEQAFSRGRSILDSMKRDSARIINISSLAVRRELRSQDLAPLVQSGDARVRVRANRAIGENRIAEYQPQLSSEIQSGDLNRRFWSAWSGCLTYMSSALEALNPFVSLPSYYSTKAIQLMCRVMAQDELKNWLRIQAQSRSSRRVALLGCGIGGDSFFVPTLVRHMAAPEYARIAGEAFSMITGVDLAYEDMDTDWPEGFEAGPTEDPADENVDLDEDEDLPWPNQALVQEWWEKNKGHFQEGQRYLCGRPITEENCRRVLREGYQRQRIAAAYELALMNPDEPLFNWKAPGFKQQEWLGLRPQR